MKRIGIQGKGFLGEDDGNHVVAMARGIKVFLTAGSSVHVQDVSRLLHGHTPIDFGKETGFGLPTTRAKKRNQNFGRKKNTGIVLTLGRSGHCMGRFCKI